MRNSPSQPFSAKAQSVLAQFDATAETVEFVAEGGPLHKEIRSFLVSVAGRLRRDCEIQDWKHEISEDDGYVWAWLFPQAWTVPDVGPVAFCVSWTNPFRHDAEDLALQLRLPWNWNRGAALKTQLLSHMPAGFTDVYDGEPDPNYPFWRYLSFHDSTDESGLDTDAFYGEILSAFRSLLSLRPIIDEHMSQCDCMHEVRIARRELGVASVLDIETAGAEQELIELAVINAAYDRHSGELLGILEQYGGLREPKCRISNADELEKVRGQVLDEGRISALLLRADFVVAHNAPRDEKTLAEQFKWAAELDWRDSLNGVDWGTESRDLQSLLVRYGIDPGIPHQAGSDARALLELLSYRTSRGTYFAQLLTPKIDAAGACA